MNQATKRSFAMAFTALLAATAFAGCASSNAADSNSGVAATASGATQSTAADTAPVSTVDAALNEWSIKTNSEVAKAGKVTFKATNDGAMPHELVVLKTDTPAADLPVTDGRVSEKDSVGEVSELDSGKSGESSIDVKPGKYVLICNIAGHYKQGMYTSLTVK